MRVTPSSQLIEPSVAYSEAMTSDIFFLSSVVLCRDCLQQYYVANYTLLQYQSLEILADKCIQSKSWSLLKNSN